MSEITFALPSFAKVNLHLRVLGKREDGYHDLFTIFQTVSLHDTLRFETADEIVFDCDDAAVPKGEDNIIVKAASLLRDEFGVSAGARIFLEKRIPSPGGLGGGSSNAAVALIGLARLWNLTPNQEELHEIAKRLGADVPFFLHGGTAIGSGRGTEIEEIDDFRSGFMLIVTPDTEVPTKDAFAGIGAQNLTNEESNRILRICRSEAESPDFLGSALKNDFEASVFRMFPGIEEAKQRLLKLGARKALLSGSGGSVFGIFDKEETRRTALKALDDRVDWRKFAVAAVSRAEYREKVFGEL